MQKFNKLEELKDNGLYQFTGKKLDNVDFINEKAMCNCIVDNIDGIMKDIFDDEIISIAIDKPVKPLVKFGPRTRRVDLLIKGKKKLYIIELKNPKQAADNRAAIGQILDYGREFPYPKKELVIITTLFDHNTARTIKHYNLPIKYIFLYKGKFLEFKDVADE